MNHFSDKLQQITYKPYPKYKESEVEWLGEIPEHWEKKKLRNLGQFTASGIDKKIVDGEELVKIINFTDVFNSNDFVLKQKDYMVVSAPLEKIKLHKVNKGDLIFIPSSETADEIGIAALVDEELENTSYSYHVLRLRFTKNIVHQYKKYLTNNNFVLNQFSLLARGTTRQTLGRDDFKSIIVTLPPLQEQKIIANYLDKATTKIDTLIAKQERLIALLKEKRQALISHTVTKGLNPDVKMKDSGIEWLGEIPEHWTVKKLKHIGEAIIGLTYSPNNIVDENEGTLVLRSSNLQNGGLYYGDNVYVNSYIPNKLITKSGDIVICSRNGSRKLIGKNAMIDKQSAGVSFGAFTSVFRSKQNPFVFYILNSSLFKYQSGRFMTTTINQLTTGTLNEFQIALPSDSEQSEIVNYLDDRTSKIDTLINKATKAIELLKERRTALISAVVTGKIDVREYA